MNALNETKGTSNVNEAVRWRHRFQRFPEIVEK